MSQFRRVSKHAIWLLLSVFLLGTALPPRLLIGQDRPRERESERRREERRKTDSNENLDHGRDKVLEADEKLKPKDDANLTEKNEKLRSDGSDRTSNDLSRNNDKVTDERIKGSEESRQEQTAKERLAENKANGTAWEGKTKDELRREGKEPYEQVTVEAKDGTRSRADLVYEEKGKYYLVECKASDTADFTRNQKEVFGSIQKGDEVTVRGKNMGEHEGEKIRIDGVLVSRPDENGNVRMEQYRDRRSAPGGSE